jgi:hypothetical protein
VCGVQIQTGLSAQDESIPERKVRVVEVGGAEVIAGLPARARRGGRHAVAFDVVVDLEGAVQKVAAIGRLHGVATDALRRRLERRVKRAARSRFGLAGPERLGDLEGGGPTPVLQKVKKQLDAP